MAFDPRAYEISDDVWNRLAQSLKQEEVEQEPDYVPEEEDDEEEEQPEEVEVEEEEPQADDEPQDNISWMFDSQTTNGPLDFSSDASRYRKNFKARNETDSDLSWVPTKSDKVNLSGIDPAIAGYINTLPEPLKKKFLVTSARDQHEDKPNSLHNTGKAVDARYFPDLHNYIANDPMAKKMGISVLDPNHGTAPHTHIQKRQYGGKYITQ